MKKQILLVLATIMTVGGTMAQTFTAVAPSGQTLYYTLNSGVAMVTYENTTTPRYTSISGNLVIPDSVTHEDTTYVVGSIGNNAFQGCTELTSLTIPESITWINNGAFRNCTGLTTLNFNADSCVQMNGVFTGCTNLVTLNIGANVKFIPNRAFYGLGLNKTNFLGTIEQWMAIGIWSNSSPIQISRNLYINDVLLTELVVPEGVTNVANFAYDTAITSVTIPPSVTSIGSFNGCTNLTTLNYNADSCLQVAFGCPSLSTINIGANVRSIPENAFSGLFWIPSLTIPSTVTTIGNNAFEDIRMIYYNGPATGNPWGALCVNGYIEDSLYYLDSSKAVLAGAHFELVNADIPATVRVIGDRAFKYCDSLHSVTLPASIDSVLSNAFAGCDSQMVVVYNGTLAQWCGIYFADVNANPSHSANPLIIDSVLVEGSLVIPEGVNSIGQYAFCSRPITSLSIPHGVQEIGINAFYNCNAISSLYVNVDTCMGWSIGANSPLQTLVFGDSVKYIAPYAFYVSSPSNPSANTLKNLTIGRSVRGVGYYAFYNRYGLETLVMNADSCYEWQQGNDFHTSVYYNNDYTEEFYSTVALQIGAHASAVPNVFFGGMLLSSLVSHASTPPAIINNSYQNYDVYNHNRTTCVVTVPCESLQRYRIASSWNDFQTFATNPMCASFDATPEVPWLAAFINEKYDAYHQLVSDTVPVHDGDVVTLTASHSRLMQSFDGSYTKSQLFYAPVDTTFATGVPYNGGDDAFGPETPIPFPFFFFGEQKVAFRQGTNGMMTFATGQFGDGDLNCPGQFSTPLPWPDGTVGAPTHLVAMRDAIYGVYEDLNFDSSLLGGQQGMYSAVIGSAPTRKLVCSWNGLSQQCGSDRRSTYQIVCYEGTNIIEVHIKQRGACPVWQQNGGIVGIQDAWGNSFDYPYGYNTTEDDIDSVAFRFTPQGSTAPATYRWLRLFDDGSPAVELSTSAGDTNGHYSSSNPLQMTATPSVTSRYVFEVIFTGAGGVNYVMRDTVTVKILHPHTVSATTPDTLYGTVVGSGNYYDDDCVNLCAYPKIHCRFLGWSDGTTTNPYPVTVTDDITLTALFAPCDTFYVTDTVYIQNIQNAPNNQYTQDTPDSNLLPPTHSHMFSSNERTYIMSSSCSESPCNEMGNMVSGFPEWAQVQSPDDIRSVCINMEHSFMGDVTIALRCPSYSALTGQGEAVLHYGTNTLMDVPETIPDGTQGGGGALLGIPYGGWSHNSYDSPAYASSCDSLYNAYGIGYDYCFSRSDNVTLINGSPANTPWPTGAGLGSNNTESFTYSFPPIPDGFYQAGMTCGTVSGTTRPASNREAGTGFYVPASNFTSLVGCPLNGEWTLVVCDDWDSDNGWVFGWSIDFDNVNLVEAVANDTALGVVSETALYPTNTEAQVGAMPKYGNYFVGWDNGAEQNPYSLMVAGDTTLMAYFAEHDSVVVHDTLFILNYIVYVEVHDTTTVIDSVHVDIQVEVPLPIHDTTYVDLDDTAYITLHDTLMLNDTLHLTRYDTIWLHDTVVVHDTIYITHEGIDGVDAVNARIYQDNGKVVVEGVGRQTVTLYDVVGRKLAVSNPSNTAPTPQEQTGWRTTFDIPASGIYLVKIGLAPARRIVVIK